MFTFICIVQEHAEDAKKMQEVDQKLQLDQTHQLGDTDVDEDTEVEGRTLALQEFRRANHTHAEEDTQVADKVEESDGLPKEMDADDSELLLRKE